MNREEEIVDLPRIWFSVTSRLAQTAKPRGGVDRLSLHEGQQVIVSEAKRFNVVDCGRRFGKTLLGIDRAIETALEGYPVAWFSPTYKMLSDAWRELKDNRGPAET
jgi:hypothetical protein